MGMKLVPPLPPEPSPEEIIRRHSSRHSVWIGLGLALLALGMLAWLFNQERQPPPELLTPPPDRSGPPFIRLEPSLIVPGPMQVPRPVAGVEEARPDEAVLFRANLSGTGYVFLALELPDGQLIKLHATPPNRPVNGSLLLSEDQYSVAYPLEKHKGQSASFVAAFSLTPWLEAPERIPTSPRSYPSPEAVQPEEGAGGGAEAERAGPIPNSPLLAWDRFSVRVAREIPPAAPAGEE